MHPIVRIFNVIWFGIGAALFLATVWNAFFGKNDNSHDTWLFMIVPLVLLCFGIGLVRVGRYLAREDPQFLMDFLVQTVDARPKTTAAPR